MQSLTKKSKIMQNFNGDGLKARLLKGGALLGAGNGMEQALRLGRNMLLARILAPEAFGLMAIILAINAAMESFTQIGIREAIVQNRNSENDTYLNASWWLAFARSVGLLVVGLIASPWIGDFYHISANVFLLQLSFLAILFNGSFSSKAYIALKKMEYSKWVMINHGGGACGILTAIACSLAFHNVLALVVGFVVEAAARCLLSFIICPYVPRLRFSEEHSTALFAYAKGMFGLPILYLVFAQAPIFVLAKVVSPVELGLYSLTASLAQAPVLMAATLMNQMLMPAFSSRKDDKEWLNRTILITTRTMVSVGLPITLFVTLYSGDLLSVIYGSRYTAAAAPFAILFASALLGAFSIPIINVYLAIGQPRLHRRFSCIRAVLVVLLVYPAVKMFGMSGAAATGFIAMAIGYVFQVMRMRRLTNLDVLKYFGCFLFAAGLAVLVYPVWLATNGVFPNDPMKNLLFGIIACAVAYGLLGAAVLKSSRLRNIFWGRESVQ